MSAREYNASYWGSKSLSTPDSSFASDCSIDQVENSAVGDGASNDGAGQNASWNAASGQYRGSFTANGNSYPYGQAPGFSAYSRSVAPNQEPYVSRSGKDHIAAGLLAIFLGGLGIHKFYLGYHSVGFIMLAVTILGSIFTLGLAGLVMELIGIIEGIIYLTKDQNSFDWTYVYNVKEWF